MIWTPRTTVAAVIEENGHYLMVEEQDAEGRVVINQPAGHLENSEKLADACIREVLEETAWSMQPTSLIGIYKWAIPETDITYVRYCFTGRPISRHTDLKLDEGILAATWLTAEEITTRAEHHRSPMVQRCLNDYLYGKRFPLELINEIIAD